MRIVRLDGQVGDSAEALAVTGLGFGHSNRVAAALRNEQGRLVLNIWQAGKSGQLSRRGSESAGGVLDVAIASPREDTLVTAVVDSDRQLRIIAWRVSDDGQVITRGPTVLGGSADRVAIDATTTDDLTVATRDGAGKLDLSFWKLSDDNAIELRKRLGAGAVQQIALAANLSPGTATCVRDAAGKLRLTVWVGSKQAATAVGGDAKDVAVDAFQESWLTAAADPGPTGVRTGPLGLGRVIVDAGPLRVTRWERQSQGGGFNPFAPIKSVASVDGARLAFDVAALEPRGGSGVVAVTAVSTLGSFKATLPKNRGKPQLRLMAWDEDLRKMAEATVEDRRSALALCAVRPDLQSGLYHWLLASRNANGRVVFETWRLDV